MQQIVNLNMFFQCKIQQPMDIDQWQQKCLWVRFIIHSSPIYFEPQESKSKDLWSCKDAKYIPDFQASYFDWTCGFSLFTVIVIQGTSVDLWGSQESEHFWYISHRIWSFRVGWEQIFLSALKKCSFLWTKWKVKWYPVVSVNAASHRH